jgi:hypothetical protein
MAGIPSPAPNLIALPVTRKGFWHLQKNKTMAGVIMALLLLFFVVGVARLFILRFESGDVYPAYSSLRSDPLGTRALYESLENIDSVMVGRNYRPLESLEFEPGTTFFYFGSSASGNDRVPEKLVKVFDRLTQSGGRLVLTFLPVTKSNSAAPPRENSESQRAEGGRGSKDSGPDKLVSIKKHWGIGLAFKENLPLKDDKHLAIEATSTRTDLPAVISWHTNLYFDLFEKVWQPLYSYEGLPLIVERSYGKGSILLCADSFFISNEALWSERHPQLLVWLIGGNSKIIFDETHQPSVAQLLRHYRFHWFFAALVILALLFIWKSTSYFVPPPQDDDLAGADVVSEKDYTQGLIALLRCNIAGSQVLQVCAREWEQTFKKNPRIRAAALEHVKGIIETESNASKKSKDPVPGYQKISKVINRLGTYSRSKNIY